MSLVAIIRRIATGFGLVRRKPMGTYGNLCYRNCSSCASISSAGGQVAWTNPSNATGKSQGKALETGVGFGGAFVTLTAGQESEFLVPTNFKMDGGSDPWPSDGTFQASQLRLQIAEITSDPTNAGSYNNQGTICEVRQWAGGVPVGDDLKGAYATIGNLNTGINAGAASNLSLFGARDARGVPQGSPGHTTTSTEMRASGSGYGIRVKNNHATLPIAIGVAWAARLGIWSKAAAVVCSSNKADVCADPFILRLETIQSPVGSDYLQNEVWIDYEFTFPGGYAPVIVGGCPLEGTYNGEARPLATSLGGWVIMVKLPVGVTTWVAHLRSAVPSNGAIVTLASSTPDSVTVPARNTRVGIRYIDNTGNNANSGLDASHPMHDIGGVNNDIGLNNVEIRTIPNGHVSFNGTVTASVIRFFLTQGDPTQPATLDGSVRWAGEYKQVVIEGFILNEFSQDISCETSAAKDWMIDCTGVVGHGSTDSLIDDSSQGFESIGGALVNIRGLTCRSYGAFWGLHSRCVRYGNHFIMDRDHTSDAVERTTGVDDSGVNQRGQLFTSICNTWECKDNSPSDSFPIGVRYFGGHIYERENRYIRSAPASSSVDASQSNQLAVLNARFDRCQILGDIGSHPNFGLCYIMFCNCVVVGPLNNNSANDLSNLCFEISGSIEQFTLANCIIAPRKADSNAIVARFATIGRGPQIRILNTVIAPYNGLSFTGYNFLDNDAPTRQIQSIYQAHGNVWHSGGIFLAWDNGVGLVNNGNFAAWNAAALVGTDISENLKFDVDFLAANNFLVTAGKNSRSSGFPVTGVPWDFRGIGRSTSAPWASGSTGIETGPGAPPPSSIVSSVFDLLLL